MTDDHNFRNHGRDGEDRPRGRFGDHPRDNSRPRGDRREGGRRPHGNREGGDRPRYGDRPRGDRAPCSDGDHREYRPRDDRREGGERRPRSRDGRGRSRGDRREYRPRDDRRSGDRRSFNRDGGDRGRRYDDRREPREEISERPKLTVPGTVTEILHKGIDCEINGRSDLAMILYLHGASQLNGGCENNLVRMLREAGKDQFPTIRGRLAKDCPEEVMPVLDYLCSTFDSEHDVSSIRVSADSGNPVAIHCLIRMGQVEKEDALIDAYAQSIEQSPEMIVKGLEILDRKLSSAKAKKYLEDHKKHEELRKSINVVFPRAMNGENSARKELNRLAGTFPDAKFLEGYLMAYQDGNGVEYLRKGMKEHMPLILTFLSNLKLEDSAFFKYLKAKKLQAKKDQWIPAMVAAVKEGSDEAMDELSVMDRKDVRKSLQFYYLAKNDVENLVLGYDGRDSEYLDQYCNHDPAKIAEVGRLLGGVKEIDWLSRNFRKGCEECRDALVGIAADSRRYGKPLVYALHDAGADIEAARVYFEMKDDPSLPSVKWLGKVCRNVEAKEYVRSRFEEMNDLETFESIFEDDGYVPKYMMKRERSQSRGRRY